jgi:hypothetical protein
LGFDTRTRDAELDEIVRRNMDVFIIRSERLEVTPGLLKEAIIEAGRLGKAVQKS